MNHWFNVKAAFPVILAYFIGYNVGFWEAKRKAVKAVEKFRDAVRHARLAEDKFIRRGEGKTGKIERGDIC